MNNVQDIAGNYVFSSIYTMSSQINKEYINRIYEEMHAEQLKLMNAVKNGQATDEKTITKQTSLINTIMLNLMRLRNEREKEGKIKNGLPAYMK